MAKYIIVAGGVFSGTGKGVAAASIGLLMKLRGFNVELIKFDPYLNVNAGILAPREHGETFLTDDGSETDLDLGHYERITGITVGARNICTSGTIYKEIIEQQESGKWLGETIQVSPHVTNKVQEKLLSVSTKDNIVIAEIGGTVGDVESSAYFEAIRQFKLKHGDDVLVVMVSPIIWVPTIKEFKTKPLQNSVKEIQSYGLQPDVILCRTDRPVPHKLLDKIANITNVPRSNVFDAPDVSTIYKVALEFYDREIDDLIVDKFHLKRNGCKIQKYANKVEKYLSEESPNIKIGVFGKYDNSEEAYLSLKEALYHAAVDQDVKVDIEWINAENVENGKVILDPERYDGIIVPGGFDKRGVEGKIKTIKMARENKIPFLGICLGLQCAVIEFARNVCGIENANSLEFDKNCEPVVYYVKGQENISKKLSTMRLGSYECELVKGSKAIDLYKKTNIHERHRHRYEVNPKYVSESFEGKGFFVSGFNPQTNLIEIMELDKDIHPFFIGTQAHPEFKSKILEPAPLFVGFIKAAKNKVLNVDNTEQKEKVDKECIV